MSKKLIILVGSFWIICMPIGLIAGTSGEYRKAALQFSKYLNDELRKNPAFVPGFYHESGQGAIHLSKYDVKNQSYFINVVRLTIAEYERYDRKMTISVRMYSQTHEEFMGLFGNHKEPIMKFILRGERKR